MRGKNREVSYEEGILKDSTERYIIGICSK